MNKKPLILGVVLCVLMIGFSLFFAMSDGEKEEMFFHAKIKLDPSLEKDAKHLNKLFLVLYPVDYQGGPPFGAANFQLSKSPKGKFLEFKATRTSIRMMNPGLNPNAFKVKAILDADGVAGTSPGDLVGIVENVKNGSKNIEILINEKI